MEQNHHMKPRGASCKPKRIQGVFVTYLKDVTTLVVGTGPAGVLAAYYAAKKGSVLMIDTFTLPRDKSCGGMIHPLSQNILNEIAPMPKELLLDPPSVQFRFNDWDRQIIKNVDLHFLNVDRIPYDEWMMSLLPETVEVMDATSFVRHEVNADGRLISSLRKHGGAEVQVISDHIVGADGPRSTVRKSINLPAYKRYITVQDYCKREGDIDPAFDCFYFAGIHGFAAGYIIPKDERILVGCIYFPNTRRAHEKQDKILARLRERLPIGESIKREGWIAPRHNTADDVGWGKVEGKGVILLAGEAGGFISPTSGEGISWALDTGKNAGQTIASYDDPQKMLDNYKQQTLHLKTDIGRRLKIYPFMTSKMGKKFAKYIPEFIISRVTQNL